MTMNVDEVRKWDTAWACFKIVAGHSRRKVQLNNEKP